ncbi:MAG: hypothetical protein J6L03_06315 [Bacteroidaceae bacterium]|nr:hypothetical protein [Bacteroidaceae bacterium]
MKKDENNNQNNTPASSLLDQSPEDIARQEAYMLAKLEKRRYTRQQMYEMMHENRKKEK